MSGIVLWIAQGFGAGRIPVMPGTFGSAVGLLWFLLLLLPGNEWLFLAGTIAGLGISVWICGAAEKILDQRDPGSIVWDEIAAMPACFLAWVWIIHRETGSLPAPEYFLSDQRWAWTLGVFAVFRLFDVLKPWPVNRSQSLPRGWGVTADDALAAVYVNVVAVIFLCAVRWLG